MAEDREEWRWPEVGDGDGGKSRCVDGWRQGWMDRGRDEWMEVWVDGVMDGWMDRWMGGRMGA